MPTEKRQRKREGRQARLEAARLAAERRRRLRLARNVGILVGILFLVFVVIAVVGGDDADDTAVNCPPATKPQDMPAVFDEPPRNCLEDGVDYSAVVTTSEGAFTIDLLEDDARRTVDNFVALARWGWFDGGDFNRVVPGFVNQARGRISTGTGYTIEDENLPDDVSDYPKGTVAMANRGPDTGSDAWFVCVGCEALGDPAYAVFGEVTDGMDVIDAINALGILDGPPSRTVSITTIEIVEG